MLHICKGGFYSFSKRGGFAGKPNIQHRTNFHNAAVPFSVVEAEPAIAVFFSISVWAAVPTAAPLPAARRSFHHGFYAIERRGIGKIHF